MIRPVFDARDGALAAAVAAQDVPLDSAEGWEWILDGTALPEPGALRELLAAAERLGHAPLLASLVVDEAGALATGHEPVLRPGSSAFAMTTVEHHVLAIRAVTTGSVLVRPGDHVRRGPLLWADGFVVPASRARAIATPSYARRTSALLLGGGLGPRERIRIALEISERAARRAGRGRSSPASRG